MRNTAACIYLLLALIAGGSGCASFTADKRIRYPIYTDYSVNDPEFADSINNLLGTPLIGGNKVVELQNGNQIFPAMLEAIRGARQTITIETYIWDSGDVGTQFVDALCERARAGVKVHIVVDTLGSLGLSKSDIDRMKEAGIELMKYNPPFPFRLLRVNHRMHRKMMVVDGRIGFTGGVAISDDWSGDADPPHWRDIHFRVEGPVVGQMQAVFMDNWLQTRSQVLHGSNYFPELKPAGTMAAQCFRSGPRDGAENAQLTFLLSIAAAQKNIRIAHVYFVPNDLLLEALMDACHRGVKVEIIVPAKTDNAAVQRASRSRWDQLLEAGAEFYEYQPSLYHCKIMIVDDVWVTAGSINFDERSFRMNDEANLNVLSRDFAATMIRTFEADKGKSRRMTARDFKRRNWLSKFFDRFVGLFYAQL